MKGLSAAVPSAPEDHAPFRLAQLLLLLETAHAESAEVRTLERLGFYDFFSANPFAVLESTSAQDATTLRLAGFSQQQLSYASTGQRFLTRSSRLRYDLAQSVALGLVEVTGDGYRISLPGMEIARSLVTNYADSYRTAAGLVVRRLKKLSDRRLRASAEEWLGRSWLLLDLYDDVTDSAVATSPDRETEAT